MPLFWRRAPALFGLFVGIDLRRPASWITLAMGGWVGWWCATATADQSGGIAMLPAAVLAVAAIGDIPLALCLPAGRGRQFLWGCAWACERAAWPFVGMMLGMLAGGGVRDSFEPESFEILAAATAGALLAAVTTAASRLSGAKAADAASLVLLVASASAAAAIGLASRLGGSCVGGVAAWLLLGGLVWAWSRSQRTAIEAVLPGSHRPGHVAGADVLHVDALPANGPLRQTLSRLAMVWALFTAAWFIGLAVPQATLQDGMAGARNWERLFRTTSRARRGGAAWRPRLSVPRLGPVRFAGGVALSQAAILGWPVLVCVVLSLPTPSAARLPLGIVIGLAAAAGVVSAIVACGAAVQASRETMFATTLVIALAIAVAGLAVAAGSVLPDGQPASPSSPSPLPPPLHRLHGG